MLLSWTGWANCANGVENIGAELAGQRVNRTEYLPIDPACSNACFGTSTHDLFYHRFEFGFPRSSLPHARRDAVCSSLGTGRSA